VPIDPQRSRSSSIHSSGGGAIWWLIQGWLTSVMQATRRDGASIA
jgi:hypothetical protein